MRILRNSFQKPATKNCNRNEIFFSHIDILRLSKDKAKLRVEDLTEKDLYISLKHANIQIQISR